MQDSKFTQGTIYIPVVDGGFSDWTVWDTCTVTCGGGTQNRERTCTNPAPLHGGADCTGDTSQLQDCNTHHCPSTPSAPPFVCYFTSRYTEAIFSV